MLYEDTNIRSDEGDKPMKKKISKVLVLACVSALVATTLTGCGKKECDICGEMGKCKTIEFLGSEINICGDCQDDLNDLGSLF